MVPGGLVFAAADVHYLPAGGARAAAVVAADAAFARLTGARVAVVPDVAPYQPGQFYLRELPPLRAVLDGVGGLSLLVIDGYADLDPGGGPGLGARAREEFGVPVIGVAKTPFRSATHAIAVLRGTSARPLYVTAAGMSRADAADLVRHMAGRHRLPDGLRRADTLARRGLPEPPLVTSPAHHGTYRQDGADGSPLMSTSPMASAVSLFAFVSLPALWRPICPGFRDRK